MESNDKMNELKDEFRAEQEAEAKRTGRRMITEQSGVHEEWYKEARETRTLGDLLLFLQKLCFAYQHDYGTICHALAAGAVAACWAVNRESPSGGITGFQASAVMWEFIQRWGGREGPLRLIEYRDMLYPQYEERFEQTISEETWAYLQTEAVKLLADGAAAPEVARHCKSIVGGKVPFGYKIAVE